MSSVPSLEGDISQETLTPESWRRLVQIYKKPKPNQLDEAFIYEILKAFCTTRDKLDAVFSEQ